MTGPLNGSGSSVYLPTFSFDTIEESRSSSGATCGPSGRINRRAHVQR
jgi:hypothetical protein